MNADSKQPRSKQKKLLTALCAVLAVVLTLMLVATVFIESKFGLINRPDPVATMSPEEINALLNATEEKPEGVEIVLTPATLPQNAEVITGENVINILLVGVDADGTRSDTMILCTINEKNSTITLSSFLRDTYVDIPGYFPHRLNTAYSLGQFEVLQDTLEQNYGIRIDGNVGINFDSFMELIDVVGGVDIELSEDEAWYLEELYDTDVDVGINTLDGYQALGFARIREATLGGDFGRTGRQRRVLTSLLNKAKSLSLMELNELLDTALPMITTDMSNSQIVDYALEVFPLLSGCKVVSQQIPAEGTYYMGWTEQDGGMSILVVEDFEANTELLKKAMGE